MVEKQTGAFDIRVVIAFALTFVLWARLRPIVVPMQDPFED